MENFNSNSQQPSQEAIKAAEMINRYMYWMANRVSKDSLIEIFGEILGEHYWAKLVSRRQRINDYLSDITFWFEMDTLNRQRLMDYLIKSGYKGKG